MLTFGKTLAVLFPVSVCQIEQGPLQEIYNRVCRLGGGQIVEVQSYRVTSQSLAT